MDPLGNGGILFTLQHGIGILLPILAGIKALPETIKADQTNNSNDRSERKQNPKQCNAPRSKEYRYYIPPDGIESSFQF
jgi:hypothetical protein